MDPKYSLNPASSLSPDTKITSNGFAGSPSILSYASMSFGVNWRHGPHQCAEK